MRGKPTEKMERALLALFLGNRPTGNRGAGRWCVDANTSTLEVREIPRGAVEIEGAYASRLDKVSGLVYRYEIAGNTHAALHRRGWTDLGRLTPAGREVAQAVHAAYVLKGLAL